MKKQARLYTTILAVLAIFASAAAAGGLGTGHHRTVEGYSRRFGPTAELRIDRPNLLWEVWPADGFHVTGFTMTLNGQPVDATYSDVQRALVYAPPAPLAPGEYRVSCTVTIENVLPMHKDWTFGISSDAFDALPPVADEQNQFVVALNKFRHRIGLEDFQVEPRLCAAAAAHSHYLQTNRTTGHFEQPGDPSFAGAAPTDRLNAVGYLKSSWECVSFGCADPEGSIQALFDAPYHRIPFLQPGNLEVGAAMDGKHATIEFEMTRTAQVVTSPLPGQTDVPLAWTGNESPDPLRMHPGAHQGGYPIVFCTFTPDDHKLQLISASLHDSHGTDVPIWVDDPSNDDQLTLAAFILPKAPLDPGTTYTVDVRAQNFDGTDVSRTWSFTTKSN